MDKGLGGGRMTDAEETKLLIYKRTLRKMLDAKENEIAYYAYRYDEETIEDCKYRWKDRIRELKADYEALDYATELIKKELSEVEE